MTIALDLEVPDLIPAASHSAVNRPSECCRVDGAIETTSSSGQQRQDLQVPELEPLLTTTAPQNSVCKYHKHNRRLGTALAEPNTHQAQVRITAEYKYNSHLGNIKIIQP